MGQDKARIPYHKQPHAEYLVKVIQSFCTETFISCRTDQEKLWKNHQVLLDQQENMGPISALLSAIQENRSIAWLVIGCDYPLINESVISMLVDGRNRRADVSYLCTTSNPRPQPLLAIWEPSSLNALVQEFEMGELSLTSCMSKLHTQAIPVQDDDILLNANTPQDWEKASRLIKSRGLPKNHETS